MNWNWGEGGCRNEDGRVRERVERWRVHSMAFINDLNLMISYVYGLCMGLWAGSIYGNGLISALFSNQPLFPLWEHHVIPALAFGSSSCFSWMKHLHSFTLLVRLHQVNWTLFVVLFELRIYWVDLSLNLIQAALNYDGKPHYMYTLYVVFID